MKFGGVVVACLAAYLVSANADVAVPENRDAALDTVGSVITHENGFTETVVNDAQEAMAKNMEMANKLDDPISPDVLRNTMPEVVDGKAVKYPHALLLMENSCKVRTHFRGTRDFIADEMPKYAGLSHRFVGGLPRIRLFESLDDLKRNTVDANSASAEEIFAMIDNLRSDPSYYDPKAHFADIQLSKENTVEDIKALLERFGVEEGFFDSKKVFAISEQADEPEGKAPVEFDTDALLKDFNDKSDGVVQGDIGEVKEEVEDKKSIERDEL